MGVRLMKVDVAIIGAGPAGLSAAATIAGRGLSTAVIDEGAEPGGRLLGQVHELPAADGTTHLWNGPRVAAELGADATKAGARFCLRSVVWGLFPGWRIVLHGQGPQEIEARYLVLATGAMMRSLAVPGWTLPGVVTVGAAQMLVNHHRVLPGRRAIVIGIDLLSLAVAQQMSAAGVKVEGVVMPPPGPLAGEASEPKRVVDELLRLATWAPSSGVRLAGRLLHGHRASDLVASVFPRGGIKVWDIPVMPRRAALEIRGNDTVHSVVLADLTTAAEPDMRTAHELEVDVVCTSSSLAPLTELPEIAGCTLSHIADLGGYVPLHGPALETTVETVFVAGSVTGVEDAPTAILQGRLAGDAVAHAAGRISDAEHHAHVEQVQTELADARRHALPLYPRVREGRALLAELWRQAPSRGMDRVSSKEV